MKYDSARSALPALGSAFDGLYFVKQAGTRFGELGADRSEMAAKIVILFSSIDSGQPEMHTEVPDISLDIDHPHTAPLVRVGHWSAAWTAVPPLNNAKAFFYAQIYARILLDDRPATIEDLITAGLNPIPVQ